MNAFKRQMIAGTFMFVVLLFALFPLHSPWAAIIPDEAAVVVNTRSDGSVRVGELYARLRGLPPENVIRIIAPLSENISRSDYEKLIAAPIRKALKELPNKGKGIRCLVTTYGVPLRVNYSRPLINPEHRIELYQKKIEEKEKELSVLKERRRMDREEGVPSGPEINQNIGRLNREIRLLRTELRGLMGKDTVAAVDSELALLFLHGHQLSGWVANPEFIFNRSRYSDYTGRILMVSRLDGPTPLLVENMIRTSIEVERTGLSGKIYFDARGKTGKDAYGRFDEDIRRTAQMLRGRRLPVVLENTPRLFGKGAAPHAALYCGWYSHKEYVDAFSWEKGAVGYHVASSEAVSLRDPDRKYWVKSMIEKGAAASVGPVSEPYLAAFPAPSLFFPLLMSGEYALAEVFAMTNPFLSWQMILVGDPLYNPFRNKPAFRIKDPPPPPG